MLYADYYERTLFNGILGSQDPQSGMMTYFQATRPGYVKLYCTPFDSFWCCTGSGIENHAKYGDSIYFHDADSLYVNLFIASTLRWRERGVQLTQTTRFPDESTTQLTLRLARPSQFIVRLRQPSWCAQARVAINGANRTSYGTPGAYIELRREWRDGDRIDVELPMRLHFEPLPRSPDVAALMYGPIVLAGQLGTEGLSPGADIIVNERQSGEMLHAPREVPQWRVERRNIDRFVTRRDARTLAFEARGVEGIASVAFIPYSAIAHERYNLYWRLT